MVFARDTLAGVLTFGVSGLLLRDALVMYDHQTDSLWSQFLGKAIDGDLVRTELELLPSRVTTWGLWRAEHPDGTVMDKGQAVGIDSQSFIFDAEAAAVAGEPTAEGISTYDLVLGVELGEERVAFAMKELVHERVRNEVIDRTPVLVTASAGTYTGAVHERTLDGTVLTFVAGADGRIVDVGTGSAWDVASGVAIDGALAGRSLTRVPSRQSFWFAWLGYFPQTTLR